MRYLPVRSHTTRNYHRSINNLTTALWSDINTSLINLSTTTNFSHLACKIFILDIIFFFMKLVNSLFHVNTDIFRINIACVASVSVWFRRKEIPRKETFGFDRARNETRAKKWKRGEEDGKEGNACRHLDFENLRSPVRGEFHISHNASLHTILSSLQIHVILSVLISSTGTRLLNNGGKRLVFPIKPSVPLLCRSIYDFRSTIPNISLVKSKRVFGRRLLVNYCN